MSKQEITDYINHAHNQPLIKHQVKYLANQLQWENLHGPNVSIAVRAIQDTAHPNILYVFNDSEPYFIYKSIDSGSTWLEVQLPNEVEITDLLTTEENSLILATNQGIYISHDQGMHWTYIHNSPIQAKYLHAVNSQWLLAKSITPMNDRYIGIYVSTNGGMDWQLGGVGLERTSNVSDFYSNITGSGKAVAIHTSNGISVSTDGGYWWSYRNPNWKQLDFHYGDSLYKSIAMSSNLDLYVSEGRYNRNFEEIDHAIYRTDVAGKTWEKIFDNTGKIVLDKTDNIYLLSYANHGSNLHKSIDKGSSWQLLKQFNFPEYSIHDIEILDNNRILLWTDKGLLLSDEKQLNFTLLSIQLPKSNIISLVALEDNVLLAIDDDNGLYRSVDGGASWKKNDEEKARQLFIVNNQLGLITNNRILISNDKGQTWQEKYKFNQPISRLTNNADAAWVLLEGGARYLSHDLENWVEYAKKYQDSIDTIAENRIYSAYSPGCCGANKRKPGGIKLSDDNGKSWTVLLDGIYQDPLAISTYQTNLILAAYQNVGIIKSTDGGKQWEVMNAGLTDFYFDKIIIFDKNNYLLTTSNGIFRTQDGGQNWFQEKNGPFNKPISSIFVDQHRILVGTNGSGIYKATNYLG